VVEALAECTIGEECAGAQEDGDVVSEVKMHYFRQHILKKNSMY